MPKLEVVNANNVIEFNPQKANFKLKNTGGPKGEPGAQGPQGPKGDTGAQGPAGASASVTVGSTTTLSPGAAATVTNSGDTRNAILNFGIPTGARGPKGDTGSKGDTGPIGPKGAKGDTGAAATVQVGNTNTGAPGTNASVENVGNEHFAVFNFTIPRGDKGETGSTGPQGPKGDKGDKGDAGTAATITVGSTTTTNPGTNATVTNSGTTSAAVLNFGIPKGATGSVKSEVVSELPETGEEDTFYLVNREATEQTATGKAINFTNSDNSGDITDFKLKGETSQQTYTGKNLYSAQKTQTTTGGITFSIENGVMKINGTRTEASNLGVTSPITYKANTTYTCSVRVVSGSLSFDSRWGSQVTFGNVGGNKYVTIYDAYAAASKMATVSFTPTADTTTNLAFWFGYESTWTNKSFNNIVVEIQVEANSSATSFEPYVGGVPAPNPDYPQAVQTVTGENVVKISDGQGNEQSYEVNLGKNLAKMANGAYSYSAAGQTFTLLDGSITTTRTDGSYQGGAINISTGELNRWTKFCASDSHLTGSGGTYTLTFSRTGDVVSSSSPRACIYGFIYDNDGNNTSGNGQLLVDLSSQTSGTYTLNLAADRHLGALVFYSQYISYSDVEFKVQLEKGSQATSYAAYFEPIELCKIGTYQDYIYKSGGKWYVHKEIGKEILSSSDNWTLRGDSTVSGCTVFRNLDYVAGVFATNSAVYSSHFIYATSYSNGVIRTVNANEYGLTPVVPNSLTGIESEDSISTKATKFKTWLDNNMVLVYYISLTPTDTEITNATLITQLNNVASAPLYTGVNNITTITPNEQGTLEIKYVTYDKYNQNKVYIWNDTLQQWQIIVP